MNWLTYLLTKHPSPIVMDSVDNWWSVYQELCETESNGAIRAVLGGFAADRVAFAFASGYESALVHLLGTHHCSHKTAFCATEGTAGAHPKSIQTTLSQKEDGQWKLHGSKGFVTLGSMAEQLVVVASLGWEQGQNHLQVVQIPASRQGIRMTNLPTLPMVPEIPHAGVVFENVSVSASELLPGDGYQDFLKPFRTIEDCYVHLGLLGYAVQVARRGGWRAEVVEQAIGLIGSLLTLVQQDLRSPEAHRYLHGIITSTSQWLAEREQEKAWEQLEPEVVQRWQRDQTLLKVAGKARAARIEKARLLVP
jgi:acyl-CoA dehydrogenase